jgi:SAM-dependent methyltransferase
MAEGVGGRPGIDGVGSASEGDASTRARLDRERLFHDERFANEDSRRSGRFYAINKAGTRFYEAAIERLPSGSRFLDYGCGEGAYCAIHAALNGCEVSAIDISSIAIEQAAARASEAGVRDRISFQVMDAEDLSFDDSSFDAIGGLGVLHHLNLARSLENLVRVMTPRGRAFFVEPLGHNPAINMYRYRTPDERTADEHPLLADDLRTISSRFAAFDASYFHLLGLLAIPAVGRDLLDPLVDRLEGLDRRLFRRFAPARKYAWMVGLEMSRPVQAATPVREP